MHEAETHLNQEHNRFHNTRKRQFEEFRLEKDDLIQNERQTVSLLVSEKASLITEFAAIGKTRTSAPVHSAFWGDIDDEITTPEAQAVSLALNEERLRVQDLEGRLRELGAESQEVSRRAHSAESQVKGLSEKCRDQVSSIDGAATLSPCHCKQERQLQLANASITELREESRQHEQKYRELQEQVQNDDRVEKLEGSLRNTQNRADELEFPQLSKLAQVPTYVDSALTLY